VKSYDEAKTGAVHRARQLRRASTDAEKRLWQALRSKLPQCKWRRQFPVGPYFADFACFAERLIIELDGGQHPDAIGYDEARSHFIRAQGYPVVRFWNNEVLTNADGVLERIAQSLSLGRGKEQRKLREGEVGFASMHRSTSPSQPSAGPLPLPMGEG
jgi:very-short-patch-repair endonuclease